ncbi:secretin N-terminal domain-containing protein [Rheinheimera texasensis]|uniref:secretin N-terminal domain-containing protein n=1 Tax=Rheinheimera texasensis TaxID=306205 RepID=UPI00068BE20D|nr:secretin N-terminal domain-containing protein [Rheinheimera texasensis]
MSYPFRLSLLAVSLQLLVSCATPVNKGQYTVATGTLADSDGYQVQESDAAVVQPAEFKDRPKYKEIKPFAAQDQRLRPATDVSTAFSANDQVSISADKMPGREFLHTVFGELLDVNYVIADDIRKIDDPVTLKLTETTSSRQLFLLTSQILAERGIGITKREDVYFIHPQDDKDKATTGIGFGRNNDDVPQLPGELVQIVPLRFSLGQGLERTLSEISNAQITQDLQQNVVYVKGLREDVLRVMDLIRIFDTPAARGRSISMLYLTYVSPEEFIKELGRLLESEGLSTDVGRAGRQNMAMINLDQLGAVALFATDPLYLERARFWADQLDQPSVTEEKRYFVFYPRFARAADLGQSVAALLGQSSAANAVGNQSRDTRSSGTPTTGAATAGAAQNRAAATPARTARTGGAVSASNENIRMTVDERSNTIIFFGTGKEYQTLLPMIRRLDVMPKQILLEATIAEVSMTDEFALGLEFALANGKVDTSTMGAFKTSGIGGLSVSYADGLDKVITNLRASDGRVNVLSNPSLVVRDGVQANIAVGNDIPTQGATTTNPNTDSQTVSVVYRKTGVSLSVTPTINAQGLVVMQIDQNISNTSTASTAFPGSPAIFERSISTEVIAQSGQTILLGGLISDNQNENVTKVPGLGDLPLIGGLFRSQNNSKTKTELVILITPKVIDRPEQWHNIRNRLSQGLNYLELDVEKNNN